MTTSAATIVEPFKQRLQQHLDKIKWYLEEPTYNIHKLQCLQKGLKRKQNYHHEWLMKYKNSTNKDDNYIIENEEVQVDATKVCNVLDHYIPIQQIKDELEIIKRNAEFEEENMKFYTEFYIEVEKKCGKKYEYDKTVLKEVTSELKMKMMEIETLEMNLHAMKEQMQSNFNEESANEKALQDVDEDANKESDSIMYEEKSEKINKEIHVDVIEENKATINEQSNEVMDNESSRDKNEILLQKHSSTTNIESRLSKKSSNNKLSIFSRRKIKMSIKHCNTTKKSKLSDNTSYYFRNHDKRENREIKRQFEKLIWTINFMFKVKVKKRKKSLRMIDLICCCWECRERLTFTRLSL